MVLPSPYEEYAGEIMDPTGHEDEINEANKILHDFFTDMDLNRVPIATIDMLVSASETLGEYAGYPEDTVHVIDFLDTIGSKSYRDAANIVKGYLEQMNSLIDARRAESARLSAVQASNPCVEPQNDDDIPF